jgi:hypothetical protein
MTKWEFIRLIAAILSIIVVIFVVTREINHYLDNQKDLTRAFVTYSEKLDKRLDDLEKSVRDNEINIKYTQKLLETSK